MAMGKKKTRVQKQKNRKLKITTTSQDGSATSDPGTLPNSNASRNAKASQVPNMSPEPNTPSSSSTLLSVKSTSDSGMLHTSNKRPQRTTCRSIFRKIPSCNKEDTNEGVLQKSTVQKKTTKKDKSCVTGNTVSVIRKCSIKRKSRSGETPGDKKRKVNLMNTEDDTSITGIEKSSPTQHSGEIMSVTSEEQNNAKETQEVIVQMDTPIVSSDLNDTADSDTHDVEGQSKLQKAPYQPNQCPYCEFLYRCPKELFPHIQKTHSGQIIMLNGGARYKCLYCEGCSSRPRNILSHMHVFHPAHFSPHALKRTLKYNCTEEGCTETFYRDTKLRKHLSKVHGHPPKYTKQARDKRYDLGKLKERAMKAEKGEAPIWGQKTNGTKNKASSIHTRNHKSSRLNDCHEECWRKAREGEVFSCSYCSKSFTHHSLCVTHELRHEVKKNETAEGLTCEQCKEDFPSVRQLNRHRRSVHKDGVGNVVCPVCDKCFTSAYYVKVHVEAVHEKKAKFVCNDCGKTYLHKNGLTSHRENHHGPTPVPRGSKPARFTCKVCGVQLTTHSGMKTHMDKHNGVRPYTCRHCERTFTSMNHWKSHERIHTGEKTHRCPLCYKSFTNQGTLYNHLYRYSVHGVMPKVRNYGQGSNAEALRRAVELCQRPEVTAKKTSRPPRNRASRKGGPRTTTTTTPIPRVSLTPDNASLEEVAPLIQEEFSIQHHSDSIPELPFGESGAADAPPSETVDLGDAIEFMTQEDAMDETHVVVDSGPDPASSLVTPSLNEQLAILPGGAQLMDGQEIRIVTMEEGVRDQDSQVLPVHPNQQLALIIVPSGGETMVEDVCQSQNVFIHIDMDQGDKVIKYIVPTEPMDPQVDNTTQNT